MENQNHARQLFILSFLCFCRQVGVQNLNVVYSNGTLPLISIPQRKQRASTGAANPEAERFVRKRRSAAKALCNQFNMNFKIGNS